MKNMKRVQVLTTSLILFASSLAFADANEQRALFAYLKVQPGTEQQFLEASKGVIEESRKEAGCLIYIMHESEKDPQQFLIYELYKSDTDLQAHRKAKYVVDFLSTVKPILEPNGFTLEEYEVNP